MATTTTVSNEACLDEKLIPFLSTKLSDCIAAWIQSNYIDLLTNYKSIYDAYNELVCNNNI